MDQVKIDFSRLSELGAFRERVAKEREQRQKNAHHPLEFGVRFLDEALGGIYQNDLVVLGAKAGIGKTELATQIALKNAALGKRVHFFALEAEENEIERRIKYRLLAEVFYRELRKSHPSVHLNYLDWYYGKLDSEIGQYEPELENLLGETYGTLQTFYRTEASYTVHDFEKHFMGIKDQTDLVIVDHLHYFDFEDDNENRAMKDTVKKLRDLALLTGKPVVLVAHLRKSERRVKQIIPDLEDFHGSSDIGKIATKAIVIGSAFEVESNDPDAWPTFFRVLKCRTDSARTRPVALLRFMMKSHAYANSYLLGNLEKWGEEFKPFEKFNQIPYWAKSAEIAR